MIPRFVLVLGVAAATVVIPQSLAAQTVSYAPGVDVSALRLDVAPTSQQVGALKRYVVLLKRVPGARYTGGIPGLARSAAARGGRYDGHSPAAVRYTAFLRRLQDQVLDSVNARNRVLRYFSHALDGFTVFLTEPEAAQLNSDPRVRKVIEDYYVEVDTNSTPEFLGLLDAEGGLRADLGLMGEDVIIGVIDTGAIQEHPSFSDDVEGFEYGLPPARWQGECQPGEGWSQDDCNNKLVGARWYVDGFTNPDGQVSVSEDEFLSARDAAGHGSHVAGTAGGNPVLGTLAGNPVGDLSGMAPRARIAVYKACWVPTTGGGGSCAYSDTAAATDAAVEDGVDVLNFSVGTSPAFNDEQDLAFLDAAAAGIFVARSAGNSGPGFGTTFAGEPWVMTVAASTTDGPQFFLALEINEPSSLAGSYDAIEGVITQPLAARGDMTADLAAADPILACTPISNLEGQIALVSRGSCGFTDKIEHAVHAGASAVIVYTDDGDKVAMAGTASDLTTSVPGVMIDRDVGEALLAEINAGGVVNATLGPGRFVEVEREGNKMADFSSRGPFLTESSWLKPDITAPGVAILAATTPEPADGFGGELYGYKSGTSMSSPHIAGIGALIVEAQPGFSPAQVKSSLMTTARQNVVKEDGVTAADPFDFGAGHVDPNRAVSPGLTYDLQSEEYEAASCGTATPLVSSGDCSDLAEAGFSLDPADLNLPSIAVDGFATQKTITRTVTAVPDFQAESQDSRTYTPTVTGLAGFDVSVSPSTLTVAPGETATYEVTIEVGGATPGQWTFGALAWDDGVGHSVRSPVAVKSVALAAPNELARSGSSGAAEFDVEFGVDGEYAADVHGINDPRLFVSTVEQDPNDNYSFLGPGTAIAFDGEAPAGTALMRFELLDAYTSGEDKLDLYVYYCPELLCTLVGTSAGQSSNEMVDVRFPASDPSVEDPYVVFVHGSKTDQGEPAQFALFVHTVGLDDNAQNMDITGAPTEATAGTSGQVSIEWGGLNQGPGFRQLGAISHRTASGIEGFTFVSVDNLGSSGLCDLGVCALE